jgi:hypothetical protein
MTRTLMRLLPVVLLVALGVAGWTLVIQPKRQEAARVAAKVTAADAELANLQAKVGDYTKAREAYPGNVSTVTRLGKAVPTDDDMRSLMVQLDSATRRSGVDFRSIQVSGDAAGAAPSTSASGASATVTPGSTIPGAVVVPGSDISTMPFTFAFEGDFFGLSSFLARMQRFVTLHDQRISVNGRLLRVESISLQAGESGFPQIRAQVKASSFLAPKAPAAPATGTGAGASGSGSTPAGGTGSTGGSTATPSTTASASGAVQ